jgi:cation diffusion facilitator CzcD-associated flavoprotein CzcO
MAGEPQSTRAETAGPAARRWLAALGSAAADDDVGRAAALIAEGGTWRDLLGFQWDFKNWVGPEEVARALLEALVAVPVDGFELRTDREPRLEEEGAALTFFFRFENQRGPCEGFARLVSADGGASWKSLFLLTQLAALAGFPEQSGVHRPLGKDHAITPERINWSTAREAERDFAEAEPAVVILGAGHSGLSLAARLGAHGIPALLIERNRRVGDNWRDRYPSLALHDPVGADHLPYLHFPPTWPKFTPKDKFANFLEYYVDALDLNVWTGAGVTEASFDSEAEEWTLRVSREDGADRVLRPRHFVIATGLNGSPNMPALPGSESFGGTVVHSGAYRGGREWKGKKALVVGSGVSAHDVLQDLYETGVEVTMLQRSATYVINAPTFHNINFANYLEGSPETLRDADLIAASVPWGSFMGFGKVVTAMAKEQDAELLAALEGQGFALEYGPEDAGVVALHIAGRDGYQINTGASDLIADGRAKVRSGVTVDHLTAGRAVLSDGSALEADLIVMATGYGKILDMVRPLLGDLADNVRPIYKVLDTGELSVNWRRSGQDGLWFMTGIIQTARYYSQLLALQIEAIERGALSYRESEQPIGFTTAASTDPVTLSGR